MQRYWDGNAWTGVKGAPAPSPTAGLSKRQKLFLLGLVSAGILALSVVGAVIKAPDTKYTEANGHVPGTGGTQQTELPTTGVPVRDGKFEFIVRGVSNARGYVTVIMKVTNVGNEAQTFFPQNQKLIDVAGRTFDADTMAVYDFNTEGIVELNPGLGMEVAVPFKAPAGTQFSAVELHDSAFSAGVKVRIIS